MADPVLTLIKREKGKLNRRAMTMDPAGYKPEEHSIPAVLATDAGVEVWDWQEGLIREYLLMDNVHIPENGQVPFIDSHDRSTVKNLLGSVRNILAQNGQLTGDTIFSSTVPDIETKAREGHLTDVSIGYDYESFYWVDDGATAAMDGRTFIGPCRIVPEWWLLEDSAVIIGADTAAKMLRALAPEKLLSLRGKSLDEITDELHEIMQRSFNPIPSAPITVGSGENTHTTIKGERTMEDSTKTQPTPEQTAEKIRAAVTQERERIRTTNAEFDKTLEKFGQHEGVRQLVATAREKDMSLEEFRAKLVDAIPGSKVVTVPSQNGDPGAESGIRDKDLEDYSLLRVIQSRLKGGKLEAKEAEMDQEIERLAKESGISRQKDGIFIPARALYRRHSGKRELSLGDYAAGGALGNITRMPSEFIELLRNRPKVEQAGARRMDGLSGKVIFPRQTGGATAAWSSKPTATDPSVGDVTLEPKPLTAQTNLDYTLVNQTSPDAERVVQEDLLAVINIEYDRAAINGQGANGEPLGIFNIPTGLASPVTFGGAAVWQDMVDFETAVANVNADQGKLAFMISPATRGKWKTAVKVANYPVFLMADDGTVNGYPAYVTNQMPLSKVLFGNWADLLLVTFAGIQLIIDPYSNKPGLEIVIAMMGDVAARHAGSFCPSTDSGAQ